MSRRPTATIAKSRGRYLPSKSRLRAGNNLRPARSPVAPNRTKVNGSGDLTPETKGDGRKSISEGAVVNVMRRDLGFASYGAKPPSIVKLNDRAQVVERNSFRSSSRTG